MVELYIKFRSRRAGSFGNSPIGLAAEWLTTTWLRFTCCLFVIVFLIIVPGSNIPLNDKFMLVLTSPIAAVFCWYGLLFCILVCRYLGTFGKILAHVLVIYFYLFSRLIVQRTPLVAISLIGR